VALALYRKHRPTTFADVIGQDHVTGPLVQALRSGRIHHAYLFSGPRGCGKTSSARILARSLNCVKGPTPEPCGVCDSCVELASESAVKVDVIEIDAASHGGVDDARDLRERAYNAPARDRYRVYIIDEAHMVSTQGFNALLKLVEEPPDFLIFVFATTEPDKVLPTIRSRTHHYPFRLIPPGLMRPYLEQVCAAEGVSVEPGVFPLVVRAGGGSMRDALSVLDQLIAGAGPEGVTYARAIGLLGVTDGALLDEMVDALAAGDSAAVYETVDRVVEAGHDPRRFAIDLLERLRDLVVLDAVPEAVAKGLLDGPVDHLQRMSDQAARLGTATLSRYADIVHTGLIEMRGTTSPRLLLELLCARMLLPAASADSAALLQRLERMERRLTIAAPPAESAEAEVGGEAVAERTPTRPKAIVRPPEQAPARPAQEPKQRSQSGQTGTAALDAAGVRRIWPEVLEAVKRRRRTTHALLMNASVAEVGGGVVTLAISSEPLSRLLADDVNTECVRAALRDVLGVDWQVRVVVDGTARTTAPAGGRTAAQAVEQRGDDPRDEEPGGTGTTTGAAGPAGQARPDPEEQAISLLESTLGARRVDQEGAG
jgi:DNA polymerase III subunit gamma/tau